jgi:hypothetical protein
VLTNGILALEGLLDWMSMPEDVRACAPLMP